MKVDEENSGQGLMGLRRGVALLAQLSRYPDGLSFGQVQEKMDDLSAPTLSRLLKVMIDEKLVEKNAVAGIYRSGNAAQALARGILGQVTVEELLRPAVRRLAEATGQSAAYCTFGNRVIMFRVTENIPDSFHYIAPGTPNPRVVRHGFGQVCLAYADRRIVHSVISRSGTPLPLDEPAFRERLTEIRSDGYFVEAGEDRDACVRIIAPVFRGRGGPFAGALGITVLATKLPAAERRVLTEQVVAAAAEATVLQGG